MYCSQNQSAGSKKVKNRLVLDKSYLNGMNPERLSEVSSCHCFWVTDHLLYEVCSQDSSERAMADLKKIGTLDFVKVRDRGLCLQHEHSSRTPCVDLIDRELTARYASALQCDESREMVLRNGIDLGRREYHRLEQKPAETMVFLAMLLATRDEGVPSEAALGEVFQDREQTVKFLDELLCTPSEKSNDGTFCKEYRELVCAGIDEGWVFFSFFKSMVVYANDLARRYSQAFQKPHELTPETRRRVEHHVIDSEYVIIACHADGIATGENSMARFVTLLKPDAMVLRP
jgi:hypothetical protein